MINFTKEYNAHCETHGTPDRIELMLCDLNGILRGKWLPAENVDKLEKGAVRLPISTYAPNIMGDEVAATGLGIVAGDPDGILQPIAGTLKHVPWAKGNVAQVQVEMTDLQGGSLSISPREVLMSVLDQFAKRGFHPVVATELEFYILKKRNRSDEAPTPPSRSPDAQNYDLEVLSRQQDILNDILAASKIQGLATDTLIAEFGAGQFEINFHHTDNVLEAAETAIMFKRLVRGVVDAHGMEATFMAKPYADLPGNGMHVHTSLVDTNGKNVFDGRNNEASSQLKNAVAGLLDSMRDLQALFAPHFNSYRRFQPGSFSPSTPDWGYDNRAAAVRIPETKGPGARLEHRISGADVNPYLVLAGILGGILHGMDTKPELPPSLDEIDQQPALPLCSEWATAVERFSNSAIAGYILGEAYRDLYADVRRDEISQLTSIISPMEYQYYLSRL